MRDQLFVDFRRKSFGGRQSVSGGVRGQRHL
jgi:hypothetical protein